MATLCDRAGHPGNRCAVCRSSTCLQPRWPATLDGRRGQLFRDGLVVGEHAAVVDKWQRHREPPEQPTAKLHHRQQADDVAVVFGPSDRDTGDRTHARSRLSIETGGSRTRRDARARRHSRLSGRHTRRSQAALPQCRSCRRPRATRWRSPEIRQRGRRRPLATRGAVERQDLREWTPCEVPQQPPQATLGLVKIAIVPEPAQQSSRQARLFGIDLPGVQIEDRRDGPPAG